MRARVRFRDVHGVLRAVTRWGATEAEADSRLRVALSKRAGCGDCEVAADTGIESAVQTSAAVSRAPGLDRAGPQPGIAAGC